MNIEHDKVKFISGPVVGILLSGKINNIEKNILLFGDYHYKYDQNECPNPDSIQIKDYLHSLFKNSNLTVILISHNKMIIDMCDKVINLND